MLIRPVSGSGALAVASELMAAHGPDSTVGRVAAVMMGSTETTFYTIAVYFGSGRNRPHPPHRSGGAGSGLHRFSGGGMDRPPVLRPLTSRKNSQKRPGGDAFGALGALEKWLPLTAPP